MGNTRMFIMSEDEWYRAAEALDVPAEEVKFYQEAFADIQMVGLRAFLDQHHAEVLRVLRPARETGIQPPADVVRRLEIRTLVLTEVHGALMHDVLMDFEGPTQ